jgi:alpha-ribazole phosphatase
MKTTVLYLVRHGAVSSRSGKTFIGQLNLPLSLEGVSQARALHNWLEPVRFDHVFSSDLLRAQQTCRIVAGRNSFEALPSLREISLGEWEGCTFDEIEKRFPGEFAERGEDIENCRPPGGESFVDCLARVMDALQKILRRAHGNVLLVGHAGVNRLILSDVLGIPIARLHRLGQDYGCLNVIDYSRNQARLQLVNFIPKPGADRAPRKTEAGMDAAGMGKINLYG